MKIVEIISHAGHADTICGIAEHYQLQHWSSPVDENDYQSIRILVRAELRQKLLDSLQNVLGSDANFKILVYQPETVLPRDAKDYENQKGEKTTREELYTHIEKNARLDSNYLLLVGLSTIVAAIGLMENNVAVIIGAMVIAPLLGPNLSLALASSLGDRHLLIKSFKTNLTGLALALAVATTIGYLWQFNYAQVEILARTDIGLDGITLALASGAAAVLSLTSGLPSVLVGVMVAVALLPPTAVLGLLLGQAHYNLALGAGLLLLANIVCINLSAISVFLIKGIKPRTWLEIKKAKQSWITFFIVWAVLLAIIITLVIVKTTKTLPV